MTVLYPDLCYNEVCFKGTALYIVSLFRECRTGSSQMGLNTFKNKSLIEPLSLS